MGGLQSIQVISGPIIRRQLAYEQLNTVRPSRFGQGRGQNGYGEREEEPGKRESKPSPVIYHAKDRLEAHLGNEIDVRA